MTKQITIYDLLPFLETGWVAMDKSGIWWWYEFKPMKREFYWYEKNGGNVVELHYIFNIAPFDGDWKDSLIKIDHFHQQGKMVKEEE